MPENGNETTAAAQDTTISSAETITIDNWRDMIPEDIRGSKVIKETPDITTMAKRLVDANNFISKSIRLPDDGDTSGMDELYNKLGRPETIEGYKVDRPQMPEGMEYNEGLEHNFLEAAHKIGLNSSQVNALIAWNQEQSAESQSQMASETETAIGALKKEWGTAFNERIGTVKDVLRQYGDEDSESAINNPVLVKLIYNMGKNLVEGTAEGTGVISHARTPEEALKKIQELQRDAAFIKAYHEKRDPTHDAAVQEMKKLMEEAYPEPQAVVY